MSAPSTSVAGIPLDALALVMTFTCQEDGSLQNLRTTSRFFVQAFNHCVHLEMICNFGTTDEVDTEALQSAHDDLWSNVLEDVRWFPVLVSLHTTKKANLRKLSALVVSKLPVGVVVVPVEAIQFFLSGPRIPSYMLLNNHEVRLVEFQARVEVEAIGDHAMSHCRSLHIRH